MGGRIQDTGQGSYFITAIKILNVNICMLGFDDDIFVYLLCVCTYQLNYNISASAFIWFGKSSVESVMIMLDRGWNTGWD